MTAARAHLGVHVRISSLVLVGVCTLLALTLAALRDVLPEAHRDLTIQYFASDAATYYQGYYDFWANEDFLARPLLLLNGTPIVLMMLSGGNLMLILGANLVLMLITLKVGMSALDSLQSRLLFLVGAFAFPYFSFGFLSLNKELYAMCSAVFFASYWLRGSKTHLLVALLLAFAARYYMLVAIVFLACVFPRNRSPRYWLAVATLLGISVIAPFAKTRIPGYSSQGLLEGGGLSGQLFSQIIDWHGYALVYPIKYLALVPTRIYSVVIGLGRQADPMEAAVSLLTLILIAVCAYVVVCKRQETRNPLIFAMMALISPIPMMWTEIGHWRYFSYIYFFLLFGVILHYSERRSARRRAATDVVGNAG
jgi:hypothetical protein